LRAIIIIALLLIALHIGLSQLFPDADYFLQIAATGTPR
jgi:hypothetical protein